jgi:hypothetical protein
MKTSGSISVYGFTHPQTNLPRIRQSLEPEAAFAEAFAEAYFQRAHRLHSKSNKTNILVAREIPVNGFGIADVLSVAWKPSSMVLNDCVAVEEVAAQRPTIRAFEAKLNDWKKGLMQAHRYSFFSDVSTLVLPARKIRNVVENLEGFHRLRVGLWGFDEETGAIRTIYTPRPKHAFIEKRRLSALQRVLDSFIAQPVV